MSLLTILQNDKNHNNNNVLPNDVTIVVLPKPPTTYTENFVCISSNPNCPKVERIYSLVHTDIVLYVTVKVPIVNGEPRRMMFQNPITLFNFIAVFL